MNTDAPVQGAPGPLCSLDHSVFRYVLCRVIMFKNLIKHLELNIDINIQYFSFRVICRSIIKVTVQHFGNLLIGA